MYQIRQFQEERRQWQQEKDELEATSTQLWNEKAQVEYERNQLAAEVEKLKKNGVIAQNGPNREKLPVDVQTHHKQQLALLSTIDALKNNLEQEKQRSKDMERRMSDVGNNPRRRLSAPPQLLKQDGSGGEPEPEAGGRSETAPTAAELRSEMLANPRYADWLVTLEEEALQIREELNTQKQRVLDLRRQEQQRRQAWKLELQKLEEELGATEELKQRNQQLACEVHQLREQIAIQTSGKDEHRQLRVDLAEAEEEVERLRAELCRRVAKEALPGADGPQASGRTLPEVIGLFLMHVREPLAALLVACHARAGASGKGPEPLEASPNADQVKQLARVLDFLRYFAKVLAVPRIQA
jgi:chromosome segregation ATPase